MENKTTSKKKSSKSDRAEFASELNADINKNKKADCNKSDDCH